MEHPVPYDIVVSRAGHDAGRLYMVIGSADGRLQLCDGALRKMANPKIKSPRHVRIAERRSGAPAGDRMIRETIALAAGRAAAKEVQDLG